MTRVAVVGQSLPRHDALDKVTGAARYPADLVRPGMLHLKVVFADRPHARIVAIDTVPALAAAGVVAVFTAPDVPFNAFGLIDQDQPVLCADTVRFQGDKVALVVAETPAAAEAAAHLVHITYQDLSAITDPTLALAPDAPLVHAHRASNLLHYVPIRKGTIDVGFDDADVVLDGEFTTSWQEHAFLQPEAGIAFVDEQERLVVETAGQWLHEDRRQIAAMLRLPDERVVVRYAAIGGAFGGREDLSVQHLLALAAWRLRRPVAIVWSREESIIGHHKRHPITIRCRWGATSAGRITAVTAELLADGGAYASTSAEVVKVAALLATGCYEVPNLAIDGRVVYTNNVPAGAFRGFGAPQAQFAAEVMVTRLAHALRMDPAEFRHRNFYREGSIEPTGHPLPPGVSIRPVFDHCLDEAGRRWWVAGGGWRTNEAANSLSTSVGTKTSDPSVTRYPPPTTRHLRRGVGFACGMKNLGYSFGFPEQATATVELSGRGEPEQAVVRVGAADVGQGSHLALRQIAADTLAIDPDQITLIADDSAEAPNAGSASASRLTYMAGRAVHDAAREALARYRDSDDARVVASVTFSPTPTTALDPVTGAGTPNYCYGYAAQAVTVEVDETTGRVRLLSVISAHDVGRAINRQQVEGQIEGCLAQAVGYALMEELRVEDGRILNPYFSTYLLPTTLDMPPEIVPVILELADPHGPFGARGVAEMPLVPLLAAISIAIHDACGIWLTEQPFTPERVFAALSARDATQLQHSASISRQDTTGALLATSIAPIPPFK